MAHLNEKKGLEMAYVNQEMKKALSVGIKKVLSDFGLKGSISIRHYSTLVVKIKKGSMQFDLPEWGYKSVSTVRDNMTGKEAEFLKALIHAMNNAGDLQNFDESDSMTDYFHVGWYTDIYIGEFQKPYILESSKKAA
jgi:hypothetical protein